ncbi:MAG TPA: hypothetical protein VIB39_21720 [Candidatus Angelobacter sp.]|jgi:hypothetical protein
MKSYFAWIVLLGLLDLGLVAQSPQGPNPTNATDNGAALLLDNGTIMYLELSKSVDAKKVKVGDEISAMLLTDIVSHGKIALRRDTKLIGHVTEAQAHTKDNPESRLGIVFDKILSKGKQQIAFHSVLMALSPAPRIQIDAPSAPSPPGANPANTAQQDRHYPIPPGPKVPKMGETMNGEIKAHAAAMDNIVPTDIDGITLQRPANSSPVIISYTRTVKLDSGVRIELRVLASNQPTEAAHAP